MPRQAPEWYNAEVSKGSKDQELKLKIAVRMDKPMNMKHCGCVPPTVHTKL